MVSARIDEHVLLHRPLALTRNAEPRSFGLGDLDVPPWSDVPNQQGLDVPQEVEGQVGHTLDLLDLSENHVALLQAKVEREELEQSISLVPVPPLTGRGIVGFPQVHDLPGLRLEIGIHAPSVAPVLVVGLVPIENYVDHRRSRSLYRNSDCRPRGRVRQSPGPSPTAPPARGVDRRLN